MRTIWIAILLTALAVPGYADVFVQQINGSLVKKTGFKTAVLAADTVGKTVVVTGSETVTGTVTVPSGVAVRVENGGKFIKGTGGKITFNGPFQAGLYQVFSGFVAGDITGLMVANPEWFGGKRQTLARVMQKALQGQAITVACYGDSLTYGQDTVTGVNPGINGSSNTRATYQYPESMSAALVSAGFNVSVINRGFPGDTSADGITRWSGASATDISFIMYGTNDANGSFATPNVSMDTYSENMQKIIQREILKGAYVILLNPPRLNGQAGTSRDLYLRSLHSTLISLSEQYQIPVVDVSELIAWRSVDIYSDTVHLNGKGYNEWGWNLASYLMGYSVKTIKVYPGKKMTPIEGDPIGGTIFGSSESVYGSFWKLNQNQHLYLPINAQEDCVAVIRTYNSSTLVTRNVEIALSGGGRSGLTSPLKTVANNGQGFLGRQVGISPVIPKGARGIFITALDSDGAYIEQIEFVKPADAVRLSTGDMIISSLTGKRNIGNSLQFNTLLSTDRTYYKKFIIKADLTIKEDVSIFNGIVLTKDITFNSNGYPLTFVLVSRFNNDLYVRAFDGATPTNTTFSNVFSTGVTDYNLELRVDGGSMNILVNGSTVGTVTGLSAYTDGCFLGLMSGTNAKEILIKQMVTW